jgi:hypothetical protein
MLLNGNAKAWTIRYTRPKTVQYANEQTRTFDYNHCSIVITVTAEEGIWLVRNEFVDSTIISVQPCPTGPILVNERLLS